MSRPDYIPQDVWSAAEKVLSDTTLRYPYEAKVIIAKAIMSAKAEERVSCAEAGAHAAEQFVRYKVGSAWSDEAGNAVEVSILKLTE